jgi:hypothetical protein
MAMNGGPSAHKRYEPPDDFSMAGCAQINRDARLILSKDLLVSKAPAAYS